MEDGYFYPHDNLYTSLYNVASALEQYLAQPAISKNDNECRAILNALLGVFLWDMHMGGYGLSDEMPELSLKFIQRVDIASIRGRVKEARRKQRNWGAESYNEFLADLDTLDEADSEIILERLRAQEMYQWLVNYEELTSSQ